MNGMKLGSEPSKVNKNSFAFDNQFIDFGNSKESENQESHSQEVISSRVHKTSSKESTPKIDKEVKKMKKINNRMEKLSVNILDLKKKYNDFDVEEVMLKKRDEKKQAEIRSFIHHMKRQKQRRERKMKSLQEKQSHKIHQLIAEEQQQKKKQTKQRVEDEMRKMIRQKQERKQKKTVQQKQHKLVESMYQKILEQQKKKNKFHLRKQKEDKRNKKKKQEEQRQFLLKRKQNYKPLDLQELEQHTRKHQEVLQKLSLQKRAKKEEQFEKILEQNHRFDDLYRGASYDYVQDEQYEKKMKRKEPREKYKKMKNYQEYVRQNFIPRTQHKSVDSWEPEERKQNRSTLSHREVKRYRYINGSMGEVTERIPLAKSDAQQKKIGNDYLAYMYSLPKKKKVEAEPEIPVNQLQILDQKLNEIVKVKREQNPFYDRNKKKNLQIKVSSKPTRDEVNMVIDQLRSQDQKMRMREILVKSQTNNAAQLGKKQKQLNDEVVDNIERKLNLLAQLSK